MTLFFKISDPKRKMDYCSFIYSANGTAKLKNLSIISTGTFVKTK
jgi:hypothetical protein